MNIEITNPYFFRNFTDIPKGARFYPVLIKAQLGSHISYLIDMPLGARILYDEEEVYYTAPNYDEAKHKKGLYGWVSARNCKESVPITNRKASSVLKGAPR